MKTAVSIPDEVLKEIERLARRVGRSRNEIITAALAEYVARHAPDDVTDAINRVIAGVGDAHDAFSAATAHRILAKTVAALLASRPRIRAGRSERSTRWPQIGHTNFPTMPYNKERQPKLGIGRRRPTFALRATVGNLRMTRERRLVDGRRLELPTSALRTRRSPN